MVLTTLAAKHAHATRGERAAACRGGGTRESHECPTDDIEAACRIDALEPLENDDERTGREVDADLDAHEQHNDVQGAVGTTCAEVESVHDGDRSKCERNSRDHPERHEEPDRRRDRDIARIRFVQRFVRRDGLDARDAETEIGEREPAGDRGENVRINAQTPNASTPRPASITGTVITDTTIAQTFAVIDAPVFTNRRRLTKAR